MDGMTVPCLFTGIHALTAYALVAAGLASEAPASDQPAGKTAAEPSPSAKAITCPIPGTALELTMIPVPGPDGTPAFWMSDAEISWDHYDVFVYELDQPVNEDVDAVTRPTRPYISADRGWGHADFPAISVSHNGAEAFCKWLSASTGQRWRLPTLSEWGMACQQSRITSSNAEDHAWNAGNSKRRTHKLRSKKTDSLGLYDLQGNVSEWCVIEGDKHVLAGSCYSDQAQDIQCGQTKTPVPEWNDTDPQIPKSIWWLADAPFAGFRVVCESPMSTTTPSDKSGETTPGGEKP